MFSLYYAPYLAIASLSFHVFPARAGIRASGGPHHNKKRRERPKPFPPGSTGVIGAGPDGPADGVPSAVRTDFPALPGARQDPFEDQAAQIFPQNGFPVRTPAGFQARRVVPRDLFRRFAHAGPVMRTGGADPVRPLHQQDLRFRRAVQLPLHGRHARNKPEAVPFSDKERKAQRVMRPQQKAPLRFHAAPAAVLTRSYTLPSCAEIEAATAIFSASPIRNGKTQSARDSHSARFVTNMNHAVPRK